MREYTFEKDIDDYDYNCPGRPKFWSFYDNMIASCPEVFSSCQSNHDVEQELKVAGVIVLPNRPDSECDGLGIYFDTEIDAKAFISRLNQYLQEKQK